MNNKGQARRLEGRRPDSHEVAVSENTRRQGRVAYVNSDAGYGFIRPLGGDGWDSDAFFHQSDVADAITLRKGQRVSFALTQGERGPKAIDVRVEC